MRATNISKPGHELLSCMMQRAKVSMPVIEISVPFIGCWCLFFQARSLLKFQDVGSLKVASQLLYFCF